MVAMMLLGLELWLAAVIATVVAFAISYIFFSEPRDALARDIATRRLHAGVDADSDIENAALDQLSGSSVGSGRLEDDRGRQS